VAILSLATLLASIGLYGVLACTVARRTREIGLRMALGADGGRIRRLLLWQVALMAALGGAIGTAAAVGLGRGPARPGGPRRRLHPRAAGLTRRPDARATSERRTRCRRYRNP
jgi:hypothetical protein